jgi:hypothetical protein
MSYLKFLQMDEERYTWIERDNHHVCLILPNFAPALSYTLQILDQLTRVTEASPSAHKDSQYKHRSMLADGQRKVYRTENETKYLRNSKVIHSFQKCSQEFQRISADNSRLHKALNMIKPSVPSLKEVEIRAKDLERWYRNGCKLPDVLYENVNTISPVVNKTLPEKSSPARRAQRCAAQQEYVADAEFAKNACSSPIAKQIIQVHKMDHVPVASPKSVAARHEFDSNKHMMGRLRPELLSDVCAVKQPPAALRQLLQAACSALGG